MRVPKPKDEHIGPVYRISDVATAAGCSVRTARRYVPDLRDAKGEKQRTYNEREFGYAVQIVQEALRKPSPRRLQREAREGLEAQQRATTAAKRGRKKCGN